MNLSTATIARLLEIVDYLFLRVVTVARHLDWNFRLLVSLSFEIFNQFQIGYIVVTNAMIAKLVLAFFVHEHDGG